MMEYKASKMNVIKKGDKIKFEKLKDEDKMKTGDKFIIEIGDRLEKIAFPNGQFQLTGEYYNIKGTFAMISEREYENLKKYDEEGIEKEGYEKGLNELWEALQHVQKMSVKDYEECTGTKYEGYLYGDITPAEFVDKFKKWKEKKEDGEIKVGDEIKSSDKVYKAVVFQIDPDGCFLACRQDGKFFDVNIEQKKYWKKTGKHYDEVEKIFQKLKESEGEIPFL